MVEALAVNNVALVTTAAFPLSKLLANGLGALAFTSLRVQLGSMVTLQIAGLAILSRPRHFTVLTHACELIELTVVLAERGVARALFARHANPRLGASNTFARAVVVHATVSASMR